jgi:hypothetical protein
MVMLRAYFDESGMGSTSVFALAGYVAPEDEWERFETKWHNLLQSPLRYENPKLTPERAAIIGRPLSFLHATDMEGMGKGRFRALGQQNRDYLIATSVRIIRHSGVLGIASAVIMPEYERLDERVKRVIESPYLLCFQHVIAEVAKRARAFLGEDHSEGIAYVFEQQPKWQSEANGLWIKSVEQGYKKKYRMGSVTFGEKKDCLPLQAADRNAFETYQHFANPVRREIWSLFMSTSQHTGKYFNKAGFGSFIEQLKKAGKV